MKKTFCVKALIFQLSLDWLNTQNFYYLLSYYSATKREDLFNKDMSWIKARLLDPALTSYQNFSSDWDLPENLTYSEFKALKRLSKNKDILIRKADKGNAVVS